MNMKKHLLATAAGVAFFAGVAVFALQQANCGEKRAKTERSKADVVPSRLSDSDAGLEYVMQWDDASKKLLFEGQAIHHDTEREMLAFERLNKSRHINIGREMRLVPPPKRPDQYSFDVGTIGEIGNPTKATMQNGRLDFHIQWDESTERFICEKKPTWQPGRSFQDDSFVDIIHSSFNSRLDLLDMMNLYFR
jgi:hypothetical protein